MKSVFEPERIIKQDHEHYVYALCRCELPLDYAIVIPKIKGKTAYRFECRKCRTSGDVYTSEKE